MKKICFCAPIKNEARYIEKFIKYHFEQMNKDDLFFFVDTGSTDDTINILKKLEADYPIKFIEKTFEKLNFSEIRNYSIKNIPGKFDIIINLDIDEFFIGNWRQKLENITEDKFLLSFKRTEDCSEEKEGFYFIQNRCSISSGNCEPYWKYPVHECLCSNDPEVKLIEDMSLESHHYRNGQTQRHYLDIIEDYMKNLPGEVSASDRIHLQYLYSNELFFSKKFDEAVKEYYKLFDYLSKYHDIHQINDQSQRNLTRCYSRIGVIFDYLKDIDNSLYYKHLAIGLYPCRETYLNTATTFLNIGNPFYAARYFEMGMLFQDQSSSYEIMSNYWEPKYLEMMRNKIMMALQQSRQAKQGG